MFKARNNEFYSFTFQSYCFPLLENTCKVSDRVTKIYRGMSEIAKFAEFAKYREKFHLSRQIAYLL